MRIDLYYDPVRPLTRVAIDGVMQDEKDIYGFLYPVREYILQTWLPASGSWGGFAKELRDLTRDEESLFVFHGRDVDARDAISCVFGMPRITCRTEADEASLPLERVERAAELLRRMISEPIDMGEDDDGNNIRLNGTELFPSVCAGIADALEKGRSPWIADIREEADIVRLEGISCCCRIDGDALLSFEKYSLLDEMERSLTRSSDMLVCVFRSAEKMAEFTAYNRQYRNKGVLCVMADDETWKDGLYRKYGEVFECRQLMTTITQSCHQLEKLVKLFPDHFRKDEQQAEEQYRRRWVRYQKNKIIDILACLDGQVRE